MMGSSRETGRRGTSTTPSRLTAPTLPLAHSRADAQWLTAGGGHVLARARETLPAHYD